MKVYAFLLRHYSPDRVSRQYAIQIMPPSNCYPSGRLWRCDFAIHAPRIDGNKLIRLVEAKGSWLRDFNHILAELELNASKFFDVLDIVTYGNPRNSMSKRLANVYEFNVYQKHLFKELQYKQYG
jgi:hypothetical protein